jgi:hypothetical protein
LNEALIPGAAEYVTATGDAKSSSDPKYNVTVPDAPWGIEMPEVESASEKSP